MATARHMVPLTFERDVVAAREKNPEITTRADEVQR
jgi:hypothetical protein